MRRPALALLALLLAACAPPAVAPTPSPAPGGIDAATPTPTSATRTPEPGFTLLPATPIVPTDTPEPCTNDAEFLRDVTVPDFTQLLPGAPIDKRWAVRNTGTCDWGRGYRLVFLEGTSLRASTEHALYPAKVGSEAIVQVDMLAPDVPGDYSSRWQMRDPQGQPFGPVLFIKITVVPLPTPQP